MGETKVCSHLKALRIAPGNWRMVEEALLPRPPGWITSPAVACLTKSRGWGRTQKNIGRVGVKAKAMTVSVECELGVCEVGSDN